MPLERQDKNVRYEKEILKTIKKANKRKIIQNSSGSSIAFVSL